MDTPIVDEAQALKEIAKTVVGLIKNIWSESPQKHLLSQLVPGDASQSSSSAKILNDHLDEVIRTIETQPGIAIGMWLRSTSSAQEHLPSWASLVEEAHKLFTARHGKDVADNKLRGLRTPK